MAAVGLVLVFAAGCGGSTPPGDTVPELATRLSAVDRTIADHEFVKARRQIQRLVKATVAARERGELEPEAAEPILAAAASLVSALPRQQDRPEPTSPQPEPDTDDAQSPEPDVNTGADEEEQEKRQEKREDKREELQKKREELQKKLEEEQKKKEEEKEGGGNAEEGGGSSENAPDDGHGN